MRPRIITERALALVDYQDIRVSSGTEFLHVEDRAGKIALWTAGDPYEVATTVTIAITETGSPYPEPPLWAYIGTVVLKDWNQVRHVFWEAS